MKTSDELHALRKDLIALEAAAALAYERVFGESHCATARVRNEPARNAVAHALIDLATIYTHDASRSTITALKRDDVVGGEFRDGARRLFFPDGRPQITPLAIRSSALRQAVEAMRAMRLSFDAIPASIGPQPALRASPCSGLPSG